MGLFQKRIEKTGYLVRQSVNGVISTHVDEEAIKKTDVLKIMGDAIKNFPNLGSIKIMLKEHPEHLKNNPNWEWFVEWFMESTSEVESDEK